MILDRDIKQLILNADQFQKRLNSFRNHYRTWSNRRRREKFCQIIESIKHMELILNTIISVSHAMRREYWKRSKLPLLNGIHISFAMMDNVSRDLREVETVLNERCIPSSDFHQLFTDWRRYQQSIKRIRQATRDRTHRKNNNAWARNKSHKAAREM